MSSDSNNNVKYIDEDKMLRIFGVMPDKKPFEGGGIPSDVYSKYGISDSSSVSSVMKLLLEKKTLELKIKVRD